MCKLAPLFIAALLVSISGITYGGEDSKTRPNIIVILADDLGYGDLGCFGCKDIPTPHIDSLAKQGVRFTDAYAYSVCTPTRASLLTGRYAKNVGMTGVLMGKSNQKFGNATLVAKVLLDHGYKTGLVGKWHLGYDGDLTPTKMGFHEFFGHLGGKIDYFQHTDLTQGGKHDLWEGTQEVNRDGYSTDLFSDRAVQFIRDHAKEPFFLYLAYNAPHYAIKKGDFQAPAAYLEKFGVKGDPKGTRGGYAAMVNCMDDGIGRVLAEVSAQKLDENTLILFSSDNGGELVASNKPLSGGKHSDQEGGVRVPWVARWTGTIPPGVVRQDPVHVIDIMPTLLTLTGAKTPPGVEFDGQDIWSAFINKARIPERTLFLGSSAVRKGKWKFIGGKLFDLEADPSEKNNLAAENPDVVSELAKLLPTKRK